MKRIFFTVIALLILSPLAAQNYNNLTPEQIEMYQKYKSQNSTSVNSDNFQDNELNRTMSEGQAKYNQRELLSADSLKMDVRYNEDGTISNNQVQGKKTLLPLEVFGSHLFKAQDLTFEPKLNIPTPLNYILGTSDEVIIDISGLYEAHYRVKVSPEGLIRIPSVGMIKVGGQTIETATGAIKSRFSKIYTGITSGETHLSVLLGDIRSIRVSVVGEAVRPGSYTLPSLASAFNALYACGGPGKMGSMRNIKVVRKGKTVGSIDMYHFLIDGSLADDVPLKDEDVVLIEPYSNRVTIEGAVKHPAIFEGIQGENLQDLIRFAGGFTENAAKSIVTAFRLEDQVKTVIDVQENQFAAFKLKSGDAFTVSSTYTIFKNRVDITGSIFRPGAYALEPGLTLKKLVLKADGVKEDAYLNMAILIRRKENTIPEIVGFNLGNILHDIDSDITLEKNDSIRINSLYDYREKEMVSIWGAVKSPGAYALNEITSIKDLVFKAKGFTEIASTDSIELIRIIKDPKTLLETNKRTLIMKFLMDKNLDLKNGQGNFKLENGDQIIVRSISGFESIRMVKIDGEVIHPGTYNISNKTERISDLLRRAGGLTKYAYPLGACLIRYEKSSGVETILKQKMVDNAKRQLRENTSNTIDVKMLKETGAGTIKNMKEELTDSRSVEEIMEKEGIVGINLTEIIQHPKSRQDFFLEEGDVLFIPRELQTVRVLGEVLLPTYIGYSKGMTLRGYISGAGGFSDNAQKGKTFVMYANGSAKSTNSFLFFKSYPHILPGSHIVVPAKPTELKNRMSTAESVSMLASLATVAALVLTLFK